VPKDNGGTSAGLYTAPALRKLAAFLSTLFLAAHAAQATDWRVGLGPEVFQEPGDAIVTRVGGWLDASYEDNNRRPAAGGINHANVFLDTRWQSLQLFVESEWEHELALAGYEAETHFELEQAYLRWQPSDAFGVRVGRFNTPFGWWVPIHWSILMDTVTPPLYVGNEMVPEQQIGLELAGRRFPGELAGLESEVSWSLYGGYGAKGLDQDGTDGVTFGGDLHLRLADRYELGISGYRQHNRDFDDRSELSGVLYGEALLPCALTLRSEWVFQHRDRVGGLARNADAFYASLRWDLHRLFYLGYRFGYGDEDDEKTFETDQRTIHTFTLGFVPRPDLRVKLEYNANRFRDSQDFNHWVVSVGYLF
jgi:hypothetical protein